MSREDYRLTIWFSCEPDEFDRLHDAALDAATEALGCTDEKDHECPHFQLAAGRPVRGSRRWAIRCALLDLWAAVLRGELS